jgi:ketosteroid isomerase-like protein
MVLACVGTIAAGCGKSTPATADSATPTGMTTGSFDRKAARAEILRADSGIMRGLASRNVDSLMRYYDPDVVSMTQGTKAVKGMGGVRSSYAEVLTANPSDLSFESGGINFSNDASTAWHYCTFEATANDAKGKPVKATGNFLQIWKRTGERWAIVAEINNSSQPRQ